MKAKLVKEFLNEGRYDNNNLDKSNSYYRVIEPFSVYIKSGDKPAGYYGASQVFQSTYKEVMAKPGDEIQNLHGGTFFKGKASNNQRVFVRAAPAEDRSPFEKGHGKRQEFPLNKMEKLMKESLNNSNSLKSEYDDEVDDLMINLSQELPSALEIYLPEDKRIELYNLIKKGYKVEAIYWDEDDDEYDLDTFEEMYIDTKLSEGWKLFWKEDNMGNIEWILVKEKEKRKKRRQKLSYDEKMLRQRSFSGGWEKDTWRGPNPTNK